MTFTVDQVVTGMGAALLRGEGAYFLGSGISAASGLPDWNGLLTDIASSLGLTLKPDDDLARVAQYSINADNGNRGPLLGRVKRALRSATRPNDYHSAICRTNVSTIWTTNFDTLLEARFAGTRLAVRTHDGDLAAGFHDFDIELLKIHGCIDRSKPDELVITQEDYEDFSKIRPALAARLRHDLLHRSLLFIGYSYRDPNIATALVEARRLASGATREHFFIAKREDDPAGRRHQELWHDDLRRFGIRTAFISGYGELTAALNRLALVSRGKSLFITGSHVESSPMAERVGALLAENEDVVLIDGQSAGIGRDAANAFGTACVNQRIEIRGRIRYFPNPYTFNPEFSNNPSLLGTLKQWRASLARAAHVVIVFDGGMGTETEVGVAREMGCKIIPVYGEEHGIGNRLLGDEAIVSELCPEYVSKARAGTATARDVVDCVLEIFKK